VVVTAIRLHKVLTFPVPIDISSITDPQTRSQAANTDRIAGELMLCWKRLGFRSAEKALKSLPPVLNAQDYLHPALQLGRQWSVSGPYGKGLFAILRDLLVGLTDR